MSTSVKDHGTTTRTVGLGRLVGPLAAGLAIAIGVGFAIAQGNDATVSTVDARIIEPAFQAETDRWTGMAESLTETFAPNYPDELARIEGLGARFQGANDQAFVDQRLAHEFLDNQRSPSGSAQPNPMEGIAE